MLGTPPCIGETFTSLMYFENKSFDSPQWAILGGEGGIALKVGVFVW